MMTVLVEVGVYIEGFLFMAPPRMLNNIKACCILQVPFVELLKTEADENLVNWLDILLLIFTLLIFLGDARKDNGILPRIHRN